MSVMSPLLLCYGILPTFGWGYAVMAPSLHTCRQIQGHATTLLPSRQHPQLQHLQHLQPFAAISPPSRQSRSTRTPAHRCTDQNLRSAFSALLTALPPVTGAPLPTFSGESRLPTMSSQFPAGTLTPIRTFTCEPVSTSQDCYSTGGTSYTVQAVPFHHSFRFQRPPFFVIPSLKLHISESG